jgi:transposase-like protein
VNRQFAHQPIHADAAIELRQSKYLNNAVEQDHRAIKRIVRPMMSFKSFRCASIILAGIETNAMIKKGRLGRPMPKLRRQHPSSTRWRFDPRPSRRLR